jgi:ribosomal protein L16 Arg81 hydroxylase
VTIVDAPAPGFASLIHPIPPGEFYAEYWERAPLFIPHRGADFYRGVLTDRDVEELISDPDARFPAIRLAKGGWFLPPEAYTQDVQMAQCTFHGVPDLERIAAEYAKGATITLTAMHSTCKPVRLLCTRLEQELDHRVDANGYVTPGHARGFPPHYDTHDVLVLQIAGSKRWRIDEPSIKLPHNSQPFQPEGFTPGAHLMEVELQPGDLLYLPRGYVHSTTTAASHSVHVTLGINVYTWADVVGDLVPAAVEREELRKALPAGFATRPELRPLLKEELARILPSLAAGANFDRMLERLMELIRARKRRLPARFRADVIVISPDSLLQAPAQRDYNVAQSPERVVLDFEGRHYFLPAPVGPTLNAMCTRPTFRIRDLPQGLTSETQLGFARYLQSIGFLRGAD